MAATARRLQNGRASVMSFRMLLPAIMTGLMSCSHPSRPAEKQTPFATRMSGFSGLDRLLGFERGTPAHPPAWAFKDVCRTQDFRIPGPAQELVLRQTMYCGHPRITTQSWTLLAKATPVDTWFFNPVPQDKVLAPYEITEIIPAERGRVVFRTTGEMHRPGGHGWMQAKDFVFEISETAVEFQFVVGRYFFSYGEDTRRRSVVGLITERVVDLSGQPQIEIRDYDAIPEAVLNRCGFRHPLLTEKPQSRHEYEQVADCLNRRLSGKVRYRRPDEPSFIERR